MSALHNLSRVNNCRLLETILNGYYLQQKSKKESSGKKEEENKEKLEKNSKNEDKTNLNDEKVVEGSDSLENVDDKSNNTDNKDTKEDKENEEVVKKEEKKDFKLDSSFVDKRDSFNRTPLHLASYEGHLEVVKLLIKYGANVHTQAKNGMTSLHFASQQGHVQVVEYLVKRGAKLGSQTNSCMTPVSFCTRMCETLHLAVLNEKLECALFLINKGARQKYNKKGQLPLELASESFKEKLKEELKDKYESFEKDVPQKRVIHKETVKFYKKRKQ